LEFADHWHLALNLDRAQRAPDEEALFVNGAHDATGSFEIGDPNLGKETANQVDVALHYHSADIQASVGAYVNQFKDFIYLVDTGQVEEGLPVRQWSQHDAQFHGFEGEVKFKVAENDYGHFDARVFADTVRAQLTDGAGNLPRIAPARLGATLMWKRDSWRASLGAIHYAKQDRTAEFETPTDGYTFVSAHLSYGFNAGPAEWEAFIDASNMTNQEGRAATSFLKDRAPLPGSSVVFGIRSFF
jgi:iron complex outermembrane receptor protein